MPFFNTLFRRRPAIQVFDVASFEGDNALKFPHPPLEQAMRGLTKHQKKFVVENLARDEQTLAQYPMTDSKWQRFRFSCTTYAMINELHKLNQRHHTRLGYIIDYTIDLITIANLLYLSHICLSLIFKVLGP